MKNSKNRCRIIMLCYIFHLISFQALSQKSEVTPESTVGVSLAKSTEERIKQNNKSISEKTLPNEFLLKSGTSRHLNYVWGKHLSTSYNDRYYAVTMDAEGNVITVGSQGESSSDLDGVIFKNDNSGNLLWSKVPMKSSDIDGIYDVAVDQFQNIFITGKYCNSAFDSKLWSQGSADIFVAKYSPSGALIWAKSAGGSQEDYGSKLTLDNEGNIYLVGFYNGTAAWGNIVKTSSTQGDIFIAKYDIYGNVLWVRSGDIGEYNYLYGIDVDQAGNSYVSANFSDDAHFEGAPVVSSAGGDDMFLIKYDTFGNFKWIKTFGGVGDDGGNETLVDRDGNIFVGGYFSELAKFGSKTLTSHGTFDIFGAKFTPNGNLLWIKQFGGTGSQTAWAVSSDDDCNYYLTGWFSGTSAFDNTTIISEGEEDAYVIKYDKNGNLIWVEPVSTGTGKQVGKDIFVKGNEMVLSGYYEGEMTIQNIQFLNSGGEDAYRAKFIISDISQPTVYVNPALTISAPQIKQGESVTFSGKQFSPAGKAELVFSGPGTIPSFIDIPVDISGNFQKTLIVASNQAPGEYAIMATDKISGKTTSRNFEIIKPVIVDDFLQIIQPNQSRVWKTNEPIVLAWTDKVKFDVNPFYNFKHSYKIEYQRDNGSWQLLINLQGTNSGYGAISMSTNFTPTLAGKYKLRITDNYYPGRSAETPELAVEGFVDEGVRIEFLWDKSYPFSLLKPVLGAAADGTARFYIVVSGTNSLYSGIQKVRVTLSDPDQYTAAQYLGKLKYCERQNNNSYTNEANYANSTTAENTSSNVDGKYWFWYVAPDDFSRNQGDWDESERTVFANIEVTLLNGSRISLEPQKITIVRPPLLFVHGLTGSHVSWENFLNRNGNYFSNEDLNIRDPRFPFVKAIDLDPVSSFDTNSSTLLGDNMLNTNSFRYAIKAVREKGYACNRLDYVCHSMGGSVFRNTVTHFSYSFFGDNNYGKGYVNKFISLHTPHQGSSYADFLSYIDDDPGLDEVLLENILQNKELFICRRLGCSLVDAVLDLRFKDGVNFGEAKVQSHLIGSGVDCENYPEQTISTLKKVMWLTNKLNGDPCSAIDQYFTENGLEADFAENNDAIVSLTSQFSGYNKNSLPSNCTFIPGLMHNSSFGDSPTASPEVGSKVDLLLNSDINGELFGYIPATTNSGNKQASISPGQHFSITTDRIRILYPGSDFVVNAGDTLTIKLQIDTANLVGFALMFQNQDFYELPAQQNVEFNVIVSPEYIEGQNILAIGKYSVADSTLLSYASLNIRVNPVGSLLDFTISPELVIIEKNSSRKLTYKAVYSDAIAEIGWSDLLLVSIKESSIVTYDASTNTFTGKSVGSTYAYVSYRGKSKTIFFEVIEFIEPPVNTITSLYEIKNDLSPDNQINLSTYPNPFSERLTVEYTIPAAGFTRLEVFDTYGQLIQTYTFGKQMKGEYIKIIDLSGFADGLYFYKLTSGSNSRNGKILKHSIY